MQIRSRRKIKKKITNLIKRNLVFQIKLINSVKEGNVELFQELIQIEKIPLIYIKYLTSHFLYEDEFFKKVNAIFKKSIFHTAFLNHQTEIIHYLLFANNKQKDHEIISKRTFLLNLNIKNDKTRKSAIDLMNPNQILLQDFVNYYNHFISSSSSSPFSPSSSSSSSSSSCFSSSSLFNGNSKPNDFPKKLICEEEIILMRIGQESETIKNKFETSLNDKQRQLFLKWLYCPNCFNFYEKQKIQKIFELFNIFQKQSKKWEKWEKSERIEETKKNNQKKKKKNKKQFKKKNNNKKI
ncbi:proteophosphoglycan ppg4 [Anaeramoeba flamelloides]|uniref:Proteophosphoglycan ppg4 n=1 Tax=Anaeramoeba flamelloides TaxID=1746091 RepID=A0AAV8A1X4_9EUKA|nr:proteophosphoglycan ppg4 [Anaeramoeba flamelloides]